MLMQRHGAGRLSAVADVAIPVGGAVGGALLISTVLDSFDSKKVEEKADEPRTPAGERPLSKKTKEEDEEDDGAL